MENLIKEIFLIFWKDVRGCDRFRVNWFQECFFCISFYICLVMQIYCGEDRVGGKEWVVVVLLVKNSFREIKDSWVGSSEAFLQSFLFVNIGYVK